MRAMLVLAALLALAPSAAASLPNPCTLLTNAEATKALGAKVAWKNVPPLSNSRGRTCEWTSVSLTPTTTYALRNTLTLTVTAISRSQFLKGAKTTQSAVRVAGLGEIAYREGNTNLTELNVWQSGRALWLVVSTPTNRLRAEKAAASAALTRLS
jgi:hypothetical protein